MSDISLETVAGKLNRLGYDAFIQALRQAKGFGNRNVELAHWLFHVLQKGDSDLSLTADHFKLDRGKLMGDIARVIDGFRKNETEMPGMSTAIVDMLDRGWHYATLFFGETQIRTGHVLLAIMKSNELRRALLNVSQEFSKIPVEALAGEHRGMWAKSDEENMRPMDGSGAVAAGTPGAEAGQKGQTALDRFSQDLTAKAASGEMDPIRGRDEEIRQLIDVLMRRRQNNPILTGEAGVGKTAVVEGFAQRIAAGDVPPALKGVRLCALDIGLMQAGASMKGEFEQRLRSVIDQVQSSPTPIILFIDEAHTLIGAGGAAGTGDAANLLKPALARGTLKTIAATTWAEYRLYFEKDPALTRRFQPVQIDEPKIDQASDMLRGILAPMEKHHKVRISDAAVVAAVSLSARYIPARQLPDKAVSLLDTACARVAISQTATPASIEDARVAIRAREGEKAALLADRDLGAGDEERVAEIDEEVLALKDKLAKLEDAWKSEAALVGEIQGLRAKLAKPANGAAPQDGAAKPDGADSAHAPHAEVPGAAGPRSTQDDGASLAGLRPAPQDEDGTTHGASTTPNGAASGGMSIEDARDLLKARSAALEELDPEHRMIYAHVDDQAVASVVADWTGIPVGRMVKDEIENVLRLPEILNRRVVGQSHGLAMVAKRIETNRAKLDNPNKPIGVFMLVGPSGVGKTETALALAEALYGGEQNMITINMSEFQEAHTVSTLKGAPPGYVGYGEGGRLTEAVRRKPYSVVLLDEVEKAHPDVHELFFQVFDKGVMEDGTGRRIDFKNTLIILTSNVGTDMIMTLSRDPNYRSDPEALAQALRPDLLKVFPPALLGRIVTIPYFPLSPEMLGGIVRLNLDRIGKRIRENHDAAFTYEDAVVDHIVSLCNDPDSGGRMIDNIVTNTLLPALSREFLHRSLAKEELKEARVSIRDGQFAYRWRSATEPPMAAEGPVTKADDADPEGARAGETIHPDPLVPAGTEAAPAEPAHA